MKNVEAILDEKRKKTELLEGLGELSKKLTQVLAATCEEEATEPWAIHYQNAKKITTGLHRRLTTWPPAEASPSEIRREHCLDMLASTFQPPTDESLKNLATVAKELLPENRELPDQIIGLSETLKISQR